MAAVAQPFLVPRGVVFDKVGEPLGGEHKPKVLLLHEVKAETLAALADQWRAELFRLAGHQDPAKGGTG